ncbi:Uncharacterised protein [Chlamydia abortus]|nr:Uncharacterised protein [Chlamydia abortus]
MATLHVAGGSKRRDHCASFQPRPFYPSVTRVYGSPPRYDIFSPQISLFSPRSGTFSSPKRQLVSKRYDMVSTTTTFSPEIKTLSPTKYPRLFPTKIRGAPPQEDTFSSKYYDSSDSTTVSPTQPKISPENIKLSPHNTTFLPEAGRSLPENITFLAKLGHLSTNFPAKIRRFHPQTTLLL